jgi:hypothetical protein
MEPIYTNSDNNQDSPAIISLNEVAAEEAPFFINNNSHKTAHLNTPVLPVTGGSGGKGQLIYQENPFPTSGIKWGHVRSFTFSLQSYERAAKRKYILLMRNFDSTKQYPDYHVIITFYRQMPIKDFSKKLSKAFEYLVRWKVRGFYVHEPSPSRNWLHTHMGAIYGGRKNDLRKCVKYALALAGLTYGKDFKVKVKPFISTSKDFRRFCAYILKFNGKRKTNPQTPVLFVKGFGLRKTGSFGKWFVKPQWQLWEEYLKELRMKRAQQAGQSIVGLNAPQQAVNPPHYPITASQRAMVAFDIWKKSKENADTPKLTRRQVAQQYNVGLTSIQCAKIVKLGAPESAQQAVRNGTAKLNAITLAVMQAAEATGIDISKTKSDADRQRVREATERIMRGESLHSEVDSRILPDEFDNKKWLKTVKKMQSDMSSLENLPARINDCVNLIGTPEQEATLHNLIGALVNVAEKTKEKLEYKPKTDFAEVRKVWDGFIDSLAIEKLPDTPVEDIQGLIDKLVADLDKHVSAAESFRKQFANAGKTDQ